jgi:predicted ATP-binding protein involved in virulence
MELIYLWVEEYKNIKEQGFNFSGRYWCEYDKDKNELTINENREYVHIFPENINVTAIVGENGAGKSTIIEWLNNLLNQSIKFENIQYDYLIVFIENKKNFCVTNCDKSIKCDRNIDWIDPEFRKNNDLIIPNSLHKINLLVYKYKKDEMLKNFVYFIFDTKHKKQFGNYFTPDRIVFTQKDKSLFLSTKNNSLEDFIEYSAQFIIKGLNLKEHDNIDAYSKIEDFFNFTSKARTEHFGPKIYNYYRKIYDYLKKILEIKDDLKLFFIEDTFENNNLTYVINTGHIIDIDKYFFIFRDLPECFYADFIDTTKNIRYSDLSLGEQESLSIKFEIANMLDKTTKKYSLILLDEPTNSFHPQWQKKLLKYFLDVFSDRNIHFIIASHSPFILSDLPKENIVFLKDGKQAEVDINTFGANIHTLLSHGFFMEDGLIGEYAKTKINKAIELLNKKGKLSKSSMKYCEEIISIIGEPIIKKQLQRMLDSKRLSKIDEIDLLKAQMSEIEQKIKKLENNK